MTHLLSRRPAPETATSAPPASRQQPAANRIVRGRIVSGRIVAATAHRVLLQLRGDRRTVALLLVVPSLLLVLTHQMFDSQPEFDRVALSLLGIFPFTTMFLVTSVSMLRERTSGTLERLLTTPMAKLDLLLGYGIAFAVAATAQAAVTCGTAYGLLGLYTPGSPWIVVTTAILGAVLGMALGLLSSAFATTEFQAVQFMPAIVMPQILLGGLFVAREQMADWLQRISDVLPLTYSIDALHEVGRTSLLTDTLLRDLGVVAGTAFGALVLGAFTLRRRSGTLRSAARRALILSVDGYPGITFTGRVQEIHSAAARQPSAEEATGRFRATTQVVPVDIAILDRGDRTLVPGMSATVHIHRDR
jgi:ABC transporter DrrB family efflux protein